MFHTRLIKQLDAVLTRVSFDSLLALMILDLGWSVLISQLASARMSRRSSRVNSAASMTGKQVPGSR